MIHRNTEQEEINYLKSWISDRIEWIDDHMLLSISGDINQDGLINIVDIIMVVNMIIGSSIIVENADINQDGLINILDIIQIVNMILE